MESTFDINGHAPVFNEAFYYALEIIKAFSRWPVFLTSLRYFKSNLNQMCQICVMPDEKEATTKLLGIKESGEHA